jgi:hypothetical protein
MEWQTPRRKGRWGPKTKIKATKRKEMTQWLLASPSHLFDIFSIPLSTRSRAWFTRNWSWSYSYSIRKRRIQISSCKMQRLFGRSGGYGIPCSICKRGLNWDPTKARRTSIFRRSLGIWGSIYTIICNCSYLRWKGRYTPRSIRTRLCITQVLKTPCLYVSWYSL